MNKTAHKIFFAGAFLLFLLFSLAIVLINVSLWPIAAVSLVVAVVLCIGLFRQMNKTKVTVTSTPDPSEEAAEAMASLLNKQNKIVDEWKNTMETRDKLKVLQISSNSQNQS